MELLQATWSVTRGDVIGNDLIPQCVILQWREIRSFKIIIIRGIISAALKRT